MAAEHRGRRLAGSAPDIEFLAQAESSRHDAVWTSRGDMVSVSRRGAVTVALGMSSRTSAGAGSCVPPVMVLQLARAGQLVKERETGSRPKPAVT